MGSGTNCAVQGATWCRAIAGRMLRLAGLRARRRGILAGALFIAHALAVDPAGAQDGRSGAVAPLNRESPLSELWSGYRFMPLALRRIEDDGAQNPASLWLDEGEQQWNLREGEADLSCARCHNDARVAMRGAATRYPRHDIAKGRLIGLEERINICRVDHMRAPALERGTDELLALTIYVRRQSQGMVLNPRVTRREKEAFELGRQYFEARRGQFNQACHACHSRSVGRSLRATTLSQGQSNAFPAYRAAWGRPGSLHRRFQECNKLVRAAPLDEGSPEYLALELYLGWRGAGLRIEGPAVRP